MIPCDIFCSVVDNLGDAGVCWRLARRLAARPGWQVRLWIDDPAPLAGLRPGFDPSLDAQELDGVDIRRWRQPFPVVAPARVVIEAFACTLPDSYVVAMAQLPTPPVWLNLEYLSAEDWVAGCHGLASPHPVLPLVKHFFFPGFVPGTGGLLGPGDATFDASPPAAPLTVSLFCYANPALPALLASWRDGSEAIVCRIADGLPRRQVESWLSTALPVGSQIAQGALTLIAEPFVAQAAYDQRLAGCHLNFIRGEDSFVRAQWADRPCVWHIYPQADDAHLTKLEAFLGRYLDGLPSIARQATEAFWHAWNAGKTAELAANAWPAFRAALPALTQHAPNWRERIAQPGDLAENLASFAEKRL